jgi:hypothetical protein
LPEITRTRANEPDFHFEPSPDFASGGESKLARKKLRGNRGIVSASCDPCDILRLANRRTDGIAAWRAILATDGFIFHFPMKLSRTEPGPVCACIASLSAFPK